MTRNMSPWEYIQIEDLPGDYQLLARQIPLDTLLAIVQRHGGRRIYVYSPHTSTPYPPYHPMYAIEREHGAEVVEAMEHLTPGRLSIPAPLTLWHRAARRLLREEAIDVATAARVFGYTPSRLYASDY